MARQRLQKILANAGVDSRRKCEKLILAGEVSVNGEIVDTLPAFADLETDKIMVSGKKVKPQKQVYYILNKPKGCICTNRDPRGRKKAIDLIPAPQRLICVGRLDKDSSGAIIITSDTKIADAMTHPRHQIAKTYVVGIREKLAPKDISKLKKGIWLSEGKTERAKVKVIKSHRNGSVIEITIHQGLNRQLRRMMAKLGYKVMSLKRTSIGKIDVRGIGIGKYRPLTKPEIGYLQNIAEE